MAVGAGGAGDGAAYLDAGADAHLAGASLAGSQRTRALLRRVRARPAAVEATHAPPA
jgi:hypothetical protein